MGVQVQTNTNTRVKAGNPNEGLDAFFKRTELSQATIGQESNQKFRDLGQVEHRERLNRNPLENLGIRSSSDPEAGDRMKIGFGVQFNFGGPGPTEFKAGLIGEIPAMVSAAQTLETVVRKGKSSLSELDPTDRINEKIAKATGTVYNPHLDPRTADKKNLDSLAERAHKVHAWSDLYRKTHDSFETRESLRFDQSLSADQNATRLALHVAEPVIREFFASHPKLSTEQKHKVCQAAVGYLLNQEPSTSHGIGGFLRGLTNSNHGPVDLSDKNHPKLQTEDRKKLLGLFAGQASLN